MGRKKKENIWSRIQRLRKERRLTQEELARKANMTYVALTKIEQWKIKNPSFQVIYKIAKSLDVNLDTLTEWLFDDEKLFKE